MACGDGGTRNGVQTRQVAPSLTETLRPPGTGSDRLVLPSRVVTMDVMEGDTKRCPKYRQLPGETGSKQTGRKATWSLYLATQPTSSSS